MWLATELPLGRTVLVSDDAVEPTPIRRVALYPSSPSPRFAGGAQERRLPSSHVQHSSNPPEPTHFIRGAVVEPLPETLTYIRRSECTY